MSAEDYYPAGAYHDPNAPWNQYDPDEKDFDVKVTQTLTKIIPISTSNYNEGWEEDYDDEGGRQSYHWVDTDDVDWETEFDNNGLHTPQELIELFGKYLRHMLGEDVDVKTSPYNLKKLIQECENWEEDDIEFERE